MRVVRDQAWQRFVDAPMEAWWKGARIKEERFRVITPGGRARLFLFEQVNAEGRPHPRFQVEMPPAEDPGGTIKRYLPPSAPPRTAGALRQHLEEALADAREFFGAGPAAERAPKGSERYFANSLRVQRTAAFFDEVRSQVARWMADGSLPAAERAGALRALREVEDGAYATTIQFDDSDTGTYHSYQHDAPFVHYLEQLLESLPDEESRAFALLPPEQQESVRRQRAQARNHLDHLMRHKYANHGIRETDIERSLGGFLIDRDTRHIASESPSSAGSLVPSYEVLRVAPQASHPHAGKWVYRDGATLRLEDDGAAIEVEPSLVRGAPVDVDRLTFRRAADEAAAKRLRANVRFPWEGRGYVQQGAIDWVSWAGHCDIKAVMEQLGLTLADSPSVTEHRADTGATRTWDRSLLLEMIASALELGSTYRRADGTGYLRRGITRFGGARNDSLPDRLQFAGVRDGGGVRWPLRGREDDFLVSKIELPGADGALAPVKIAEAFLRFLPDAAKVDFAPNPRFLKTVEGDYNVIDVSGARIEATLNVDVIDERTGYPRKEKKTTTIDLRPDAERSFLGTQVEDAAARRIVRGYVDPRRGEFIAEVDEYVQENDKWIARAVERRTTRVPLARPLRCTLSREMKQDDPAMFQALLEVALRRAQNINADTTAAAEVWNGTVTRIEAARVAENRAARVERWTFTINARFGTAKLDYLMRRDEEGRPSEFCPLPEGDAWIGTPDFLWQDFPDVGSKGFEEGDWIVNETMIERELIGVRLLRSGEPHVEDDHVKNVFEIVFCALDGWPFTIVHGNKRHGFRSKDDWQAAVNALGERRAALKFE